MLIDANTTREALLVVVAINDYPDDDGKTWCEFYPVDKLLELRNDDAMMRGHPLLDLNPNSDNLHVLAESKPPHTIRLLKRILTRQDKNGDAYFVGLQRETIRGRFTGKVRFVPRLGVDYLSNEDITWLDALAQSGAILADELRAVAAIGAFMQAFYPVAAKHAKRTRKPKRKRKERRRLERVYD